MADVTSPSLARSSKLSGAVLAVVKVNTGAPAAAPPAKLAAATRLELKLPAAEPLPSDKVTARANAPT